jgi:predicted MPP superfamily phosphohydrolase
MPRLEKGPSRYNSRVRVGRRTAIKGLVATGLGAVTGTALYGVGYERHRIGVTEATLPVSGLAPPLDGLRIGLVTDIHHSRMVPADDVTQAVQLVMAAQPDIIVLGGDYVTWGERGYVGPVAELLAPLAAPHGIFAILGNHDDGRDMPAALSARGFTVLRDARTQIHVRGEPLDIAGIDYWTRKVATIERVIRGASPNLVLLAHTPSRLIEAAALAVPLVLSGHTHGGQIVLPGLGAVAARAFPVVAGSARRESTTIFVSRGVGTVYLPVRLNCPPEVAVLTLQPVEGFEGRSVGP